MRLLHVQACAMFVAEVDAYAASGLPTARPNSMNKYGLVLNEIGMEHVFDSLQERVLQNQRAANDSRPSPCFSPSQRPPLAPQNLDRALPPSGDHTAPRAEMTNQFQVHGLETSVNDGSV